jgi:hypothetical protein
MEAQHYIPFGACVPQIKRSTRCVLRPVLAPPRVQPLVLRAIAEGRERGHMTPGAAERR